MTQATTIQKLQVLTSVAIAGGIWYAIVLERAILRDREVPMATLVPPFDDAGRIVGEGSFFTFDKFRGPDNEGWSTLEGSFFPSDAEGRFAGEGSFFTSGHQ